MFEVSSATHLFMPMTDESLRIVEDFFYLNEWMNGTKKSGKTVKAPQGNSICLFKKKKNGTKR